MTTGRWGNKSLTNYQMARQLWDVKLGLRAAVAGLLPAALRSGRRADAAFLRVAGADALERRIAPGWSSNLASRLNEGAAELFVEPHLRYGGSRAWRATRPRSSKWSSTARRAAERITRAAALPLPERIQARIAEDERMFTYGERTLAYYHECVQAFRARRAQASATRPGRHYAEAKRLAELLRQDTWSPGLAFTTDEPFT